MIQRYLLIAIILLLNSCVDDASGKCGTHNDCASEYCNPTTKQCSQHPCIPGSCPNGRCELENDLPTCICNENFRPDEIELRCKPLCEDIKCSGHGSCAPDLKNQIPVCQCDSGYHHDDNDLTSCSCTNGMEQIITNGCGFGTDLSDRTEQCYLNEWHADPCDIWINQGGKTAVESGEYTVKTVTDPSGNIFLLSHPEKISTLAKYDSYGVLLWQQSIEHLAKITDITLDLTGNLLVTGFTTGHFDGHHNSGEEDIFIARYSADGVVEWIKQIGTPLLDKAYSIAIAPDQSIYITGETKGDLNGTLNPYKVCVNSLPCEALFIAKYDQAGNQLWTTLSTLENSVPIDNNAFPVKATGMDLTIDQNGFIFILGIYNSDEPGSSKKSYLSRYTTSGGRFWIKQLQSGEGKALLTANGMVYITGDIGPHGFPGPTYPFLTQYTLFGVENWFKTYYPPEENQYDQYTSGIAADNAGNIYTTGRRCIGDYTKCDILLIQHDQDGIFQWEQVWGSTGADSGDSISIDPENHIVITGITNGVLYNNISSGGDNWFLLKWQQ